MQIVRLFAGLVLVFTLALGRAGQGSAETVAGQDDPVFLGVLALWLDDEEKLALPRLSALALDGNIAARLMLGMIDKDIALQGPWLALQPRAERIAVLRMPGGLSGSSWLRSAGDSQIATLWLDVLESNAGIATALKFADIGENRALRVGLISLEARQMTGFGEFADDPRFPDSLRYLVLREVQKSGDLNDTSDLGILSPGDPQRELLSEAIPKAALSRWLAKADVALPLRRLCEIGCPAGTQSCLWAGYRALGGYRRLVTLGSPVTALISEAEFADSPRGQATVLRRALSFANLTEARLRPIAAVDTCFAELLDAEGQRF